MNNAFKPVRLIGVCAAVWIPLIRPAVGQLALPSTMITSVSSTGAIHTGDVVTASFRMLDYRGGKEVDGFNFVVRYDSSVLAFVPGSAYFGTNTGVNQSWLTKTNQETVTQGLQLRTVGELMEPGSIVISALDHTTNWQRRGTIAPSGFLASVQFRAIGPGTSVIHCEPYADRVLYDVNWGSAGTVSFGVANVSVHNPVLVSVSASNSVTSETSLAPAAFVVSRTGATNSALEVPFHLTGSAFYGRDYTSVVINPLIIPAGASNASLTIQPLNDSEGELPETVSFALVQDAAFDPGASSSATITIQDNDQMAPVVSLTATPSGSFFITPTNLALTATATDADGTVNRVEFFLNGTNKLGERLSAPFTFVWTNTPPGAHSLTAVARDNLSAQTTAFPVYVVINALPTVSILSPSNGAAFNFPDPIPVAINAADADGGIASVELYNGPGFIGASQNSPHAFLWSNAPMGTNPLTAWAMDNRGVRVASATVSVITQPTTFRDHFTNSGVIHGATNYIVGNITNFTRETGEPQHAGRNGTRSGWLTWTAPVGGPCVMDTSGSSFDTVLGVYTGAAVSNLTTIASNDDANGDVVWSRVSFNATAGNTYRIAVDSYAANNGGNVVFQMSLAITNPVIFSHPQHLTVDQGYTAQFACRAAGTSPLSYQWRRNGTNIPGATTPTLTLTNIQNSNAGVYSVVVSNPSGSVTSSNASLTVRLSPTVVAAPANQVTDPQSNATFSVTTTGAAPLVYQWSYNGASLLGATNWTHTHVAARHSDAGSYSVTVRSPLGAVTSGPAQLIVRPEIVEVTPGTNGSALLYWQGTPNTSYALECKPSFDTGTNWTLLTVITNAAVDGTYTHSITNISNPRFYRLKRLP